MCYEIQKTYNTKQTNKINTNIMSLISVPSQPFIQVTIFNRKPQWHYLTKWDPALSLYNLKDPAAFTLTHIKTIWQQVTCIIFSLELSWTVHPAEFCINEKPQTNSNFLRIHKHNQSFSCPSLRCNTVMTGSWTQKHQTLGTHMQNLD